MDRGAAWGELLGGLALAIGFLTPIFVPITVIGLRGVTDHWVEKMLGVARSAPLLFVVAFAIGTTLAAVGGVTVPSGRSGAASSFRR